jgi:cardiolipin synthase (CMP-forming)
VESQADSDAATDRLFTIPNVISLARLLGVPVFLWLVLVPEADWWALGVLALAGISDWLDGKLARALNQTSRFGVLIDPAADRLYIWAALIGLTAREIIPLWLAVVLVCRDALFALLLVVLRRYGHGPPPVHFVGKTATLCLMYAFPLLFLGDRAGDIALVAKIIGWSFAIWGTALYWWAGVLYVIQARGLIRAVRAERAGTRLPAGDSKGATTRP